MSAPVRRDRWALVLVAVVFGVPFVVCLAAALSGHPLVARLVFFGAHSPVVDWLTWAVAVALGALWLGVTVQFGGVRLPERIRNAVGAGLTLGGFALLLLSGRLLSLAH